MLKKLLALVLLAGTFLTGCSRDRGFSLLPEEIVAHAMEANEKIDSYYMETKMTMYEDDEVIEETNMKQWLSIVSGKAKTRVEIISSTGESAIGTNDGKSIISYDEKNNMAFIVEVTDDMIDMLGSTFKDQTAHTLERLNKTHDVENLGEEEINGVKAYHLKGTPKKEDSIIGEQEIWIDKETWVVVKTITSNLGNKTEVEVVKLNSSPEIYESLFTQEIPEGVEIINLDDNELSEEIVTIEELTEKMGKPILYVPESLGYELRQIKAYKFNNEDESYYDEVSQEYFKDGVNKFNIYLVKPNDDLSERELLPGEKEIEIRETKGYLLDDFMRRISFKDNETQYTLHIQDDDMEMKEAMEIVENMIFFK